MARSPKSADLSNNRKNEALAQPSSRREIGRTARRQSSPWREVRPPEHFIPWLTFIRFKMADFKQFLVLADDLTGAAECGAQLARRGIPAPIQIRPGSSSPDHSACPLPVVLNCDTRRLEPKSAAEVIAAQLARRFEPPVSCIYKKTDSTLRGNLGGELEALSGFAPESPIIYVPAYPRLGRTCRDGILCLDGVPISETEFGRESSRSLNTSSIPQLLSQQSSIPVTLVRKAHHLSTILESCVAGNVLVCDAETDDELEELARAVTSVPPPWLWAGPAAFLGATVEALGNPPSSFIEVQSAGKLLWICGSPNPRSQDQIEDAAKKGTIVASLPPFFLEPWNSLPKFSPRGFAKILAMQLREKKHLILAGPSSMQKGMASSSPPVTISPLISQSLGEVVAEIFLEEFPDVLGICGGDTAQAVLEALGIATIHPLGELFEGIPISKIHYGDRSLLLITKAGGFGPVNLIDSIINSGK